MAERGRICGAKTRKGTPCQRKPMANGRCHFHGGKSTGAPKGNQNALKHGRYSRLANPAIQSAVDQPYRSRTDQ